MSRVSTAAQDVVERSQMEFLNETRTCTIIKDMPELTIAGKKVGPFAQSTETDLPNWALEKLVGYGYAELDPDEDYASLHEIQNIYRTEDDSPHKGLQPIHPLLYSAINRQILQLRNERASMDPKQYDEIEKVKRLVDIISQKRLSKVLRVAISGAFQDKRRDMTVEERWLCGELSKLLSDWRKVLFI